MTTRQLSAKTGVSRSTVARWLNKLIKEGVLRCVKSVRTNSKYKNTMRYLFCPSVYKMLVAIAKKRAYKIFKKNGTLKIYLLHKYKKHFKNNKIKIIFSDKVPLLQTAKGFISMPSFDLRTKSGERNVANESKIQQALKALLEINENAVIKTAPRPERDISKFKINEAKHLLISVR